MSVEGALDWRLRAARLREAELAVNPSVTMGSIDGLVTGPSQRPYQDSRLKAGGEGDFSSASASLRAISTSPDGARVAAKMRS